MFVFYIIFMFVCYHGTNFVFARSPVLSTSSGSVFCPQQHNLSDNMIVQIILSTKQQQQLQQQQQQQQKQQQQL